MEAVGFGSRPDGETKDKPALPEIFVYCRGKDLEPDDSFVPLKGREKGFNLASLIVSSARAVERLTGAWIGLARHRCV